MFKFLTDISGFNRAFTADVPIAKETKITKGQIVKIVSNKAEARIPGPYLGVANETHTGEYDAFNPRNNGELINVVISPRAVYAVEAPVLEFKTVGANETKAVSPAFVVYTTTDFVGGSLIFLSKGPTSGNTDKPGEIRQITAYDVPTRTLTLTEGGIIGVDDKYAYIPPIGFRKLELNTTCTKIILTEAVGDFTITGYNLDTAEIHVICRNNLIN